MNQAAAGGPGAAGRPFSTARWLRLRRSATCRAELRRHLRSDLRLQNDLHGLQLGGLKGVEITLLIAPAEGVLATAVEIFQSETLEKPWACPPKSAAKSLLPPKGASKNLATRTV